MEMVIHSSAGYLMALVMHVIKIVQYIKHLTWRYE